MVKGEKNTKAVEGVNEVKPVDAVKVAKDNTPVEASEPEAAELMLKISMDNVKELSNIIDAVVNAEKVGAADFRGAFFSIVNKLNSSIKQ